MDLYGFAARIFQIRSALGLSYKEMAKRFGGRPINWSYAESAQHGGTLTKTASYAALADAGFSLDWLFTGEGQMYRAASQVPVAPPLTRSAINKLKAIFGR